MNVRKKTSKLVGLSGGGLPSEGRKASPQGNRLRPSASGGADQDGDGHGAEALRVPVRAFLNPTLPLGTLSPPQYAGWTGWVGRPPPHMRPKTHTGRWEDSCLTPPHAIKCT